MRRRLLGTGWAVIGLAASAGLGWLAIRGLDWGLVAKNLTGASFTLLLVSVAVFMFASYLRAVRWRILFANERISTARLFVIQNEGIGLNNVMPLRVASEVTQLAILTLRDGIKGATALATLRMERVIDVVASTIILGFAFLIIPELKDYAGYMWGLIGFAIAAVALVRLFAWSSGSLTFIRRIPFLGDLADAVRDLEHQRLRIVTSLLVSVAYWLLVGITAWIAAVAVDLPISPVTATLVIMGTIFFATSVPGAPSAVGTFEFAVIYVLAFFGIERTAGFAYAVVIHVLFFLPPTIMAVLFLPREGVLSFRRRRGLVVADAGPRVDSLP
jgi:uncharacterized membrane protein YbhN (UPF0104 family)